MTSKPTKFVLIACLILMGCDAKKFSCQKIPMYGNSERQCVLQDRSDKEFFKQEYAYCFSQSKPEWLAIAQLCDRTSEPGTSQNRECKDTLKKDNPGHWSSIEAMQVCVATLDECKSWRNALGSGFAGQPPTKTECRLTTPNEATE